MFRNKFASRLNSFSSRSDLFIENQNIKMSTIDLIKRASLVKGLTDIDLNYPDHLGKNFKEVFQCASDKGLNINGLAMRYYTDPNFKIGAFTNPDKKIRQKAIDMTKRGIDLARESGSNLMTIWLGQDGFDYGFQVDYSKLWEDEINGIREVASHDPQCDISIEYKPNDPRAYSLLPNLSSTLLALSEINLPNIGVTLDFAHLLYANEQPAHSASMVAKKSKLLGVHLNDGYGKRDDGMMVASVHYQATVELLYQINNDGYEGVIYFDTFPDSSGLDPVKECEINIKNTKKIFEVVEKLQKNNELKIAMKNHDTVTSQNIFLEALGQKNSK